jgi:recombination protein RecA
MEQIRKKYGEGSIICGDVVVKDIDAIPTGCLGLDIALGVGGFPRGRISEIFGAEGSGKTTVALETIAQAQKADGRAAFIDVEHALDIQYAQKVGVNIQDMMISQPDSAEEALSIMQILCESKSVDIVVLDSVAALVPQAELDGDMGDHHVGLQPRLMSQALRKIKGLVNKSHTVALFINQLRQKIGITFGSPDVTPGGKALKFYTTVRVDLRRISTVKGKAEKGEEANPVGHKVRAKVVKNKVAPPFRQAEFEVTYTGRGVNNEAEIIEHGAKCGILKKSGSWYSYDDARLGQGLDACSQFLMDNPDMAQELEEKILKLKMPWRIKDGGCSDVGDQ